METLPASPMLSCFPKERPGGPKAPQHHSCTRLPHAGKQAPRPWTSVRVLGGSGPSQETPPASVPLPEVTVDLILASSTGSLSLLSLACRLWPVSIPQDACWVGSGIRILANRG